MIKIAAALAQNCNQIHGSDDHGNNRLIIGITVMMISMIHCFSHAIRISLAAVGM
jgi:hypothetical protein